MGFDTSEWVSRTAHEEGRETTASLSRRSRTHQTVFQNSYPRATELYARNGY